jgi:hypothetical protein
VGRVRKHLITPRRGDDTQLELVHLPLGASYAELDLVSMIAVM